MSDLWAYGQWRWALLAAPLAILALMLYGALRRRALLRAAGDHRLIQRLTESVSPQARLFKAFLLFLALSLLVAAALRPQYGRKSTALQQSGIDIAIAFDISKSMLARDVQPARIEAARGELERLLASMSGHRMALVPFAGVAFTQSPLTHDRSAMRLYLNALDPIQMPVGGTNLAMAIDQSVQLLTGEGDRGLKKQADRAQVILLITDGEDARPDEGKAAREAAERAAEAGVKIFAVAVGTRLGEPIPILNRDGTHAGYMKDAAGKPIYSKLNDSLLRELARIAEPSAQEERVFFLDGESSVVAPLAQIFEQLQSSALEGAVRHQRGEKFQLLLLPALLLLLLELSLSERRRRRVAQVGGQTARALPGDRLQRGRP